MPPDLKATAHAIKRLWVGLALFLLNAGALFLALNGAAQLALRLAAAGPRELGRTVARHGIERVAGAYPGWRREDLLVLLDESERAFENAYEPFTEFRPKPQRGRYFNVGPEGLRRVPRQGPWPPDPAALNVFVFGGSTTFGVGAPDDQTIPAYLGERLARVACGPPIRVYNLGRPAYYSAQERILFEQLLVAARVPRLAVFVDGLNEFYIWPRPLAADVLRAALAGTFQRGVPERLGELLEALPLVRGARALRARLAKQDAPAAAARDRPDPESVLAEWEANRLLIDRVAQAYGVATLFVWQPVPCYGYDLRFHLFAGADGLAQLTPARMRLGYEMMQKRRAKGGEDFLWLADLQQDWRENLYVTDMHYRPVLSKAIADRIAQAVIERRLLGCAGASR